MNKGLLVVAVVLFFLIGFSYLHLQKSRNQLLIATPPELSCDVDSDCGVETCSGCRTKNQKYIDKSKNICEVACVNPICSESRCISPSRENSLPYRCQTQGGTWLAQYKECESESSPNLTAQWCNGLNGKFSECESPCRHEAINGRTCITICTKVCKLN